MSRYFLAGIIVASCTFYASSCNRKTADTGNTEELLTGVESKQIIPEITADEPYKNQPNELCTVIRKLDISYYDPGKNVDDVSEYPDKYCLLDICLDDGSNYSGIVNIGDSIEPINTIFQLIKVFETDEEAKMYAQKFGIKDMQ
jgi:hypothetical protein